ncbi:MAG TPA: flippase-like domain-containing protein [Euryarchaeota archaeon]|nr:flippase-like domain-containing protein [Euryarchaeota archaeon]
MGLQKYWRIVFVAVLLALAMIYREEAERIVNIVVSSPPWLFFACLFLVVAEFLLQALRMKLVFSKNWAEILRAYAVGLMVALSFPSRTLGEGARIAVMAKELKVKKEEMAAYVSVERVADVVVLATAASLVLLEVHPFLLAAAVLGICTFLAVIESDTVYRKVNRGPVPELLRKYIEESRKIVKDRALFAAILGISVVLWGIDFLRMWVVVHTMGGTIDYTAVASLVSLAYIVSALSFLPGGLGVYEGGLAGGLVLKGVPHDVAVAATLYERLFSYWLWILVGAAAGAFKRENGSSSTA